MSNIEKIRQEIERQLEYFKGKEDDTWDDCDNYTDEDAMWYQGHWKMCSRLLTFIESLPEETCEDSLQVKEICKENPDSFTGDLNNELENYYGRVPDDDDKINAARHFAEWGASQIPMPEDTVIFQRGVAEGRRMEREELPRWKKGPADSAIRARDYWPVSNAPVLGKPETRDYLIVKRGKSMLLAFHAEEGDYYLSTEELDKIPTE